MGENIQTSTKPTNNTDEGEDHKFLRIIRKLHGESSRKMRNNRLWLIKPNTEHGKAQSTNDGGKESSPVVPDGKVDTSDLYTEQDATYGTGKAAGDPHGHRGSQHL